MKKKQILITTVLLFAIGLFYMTLGAKVLATEDEVITKGVYIDSINIGGMTASEAKQAVQEYVDDLKSKKITVHVDEQSETISLGDLDYDYVENNYIEEALKIGKTGNLIKRYKELKDIEENSLVYNLEFKISDEKLLEFVNTKCSAYNIPAVNATVKRKNGQFIYTDHSVGRKVEVEKTVDALKKAILEDWNQQDIKTDAVVVDDVPLYTRDLVEKCDNKLGSFSTTFATSSEDRAGNLANGAKLINNTVLYPGDVFSAYDKLTPFTIENGYFQAGAYANGKVVDSIGGGACQVTTTLYNAVLMAELEIVERSAHSMTISYVDLSRDAAIAGTWKDLKFKNNTDVPILIEGYTVGRTIYFNIYGDETRDTVSRKVKYETVILDEKQPGEDVITEDPTKPTTYVETTQSAHIGYVAELYKVVYENGVEVSRTRVNKSVYNASPRYITIGTKKVNKNESDNKKPKDAATDITPTKTPTKTPTDNNTNENSIDDNLQSGENTIDDSTIEEIPIEDTQN